MKLLNGQCEIDFKIYLLNFIKKEIAWENETPDTEDINRFFEFPLSMKWGVYQDFFDEKQILFGKEFEDDFWLFTECPIYINPKKDNYVSIEKIESRKEVLIKANEIYNKRYEKV